MRRGLDWVRSQNDLFYASINGQIRDALIENNTALAPGYEAYIEKDKLIATQIQAKPEYRSKRILLHLKIIHNTVDSLS